MDPLAVNIIREIKGNRAVSFPRRIWEKIETLPSDKVINVRTGAVVRRHQKTYFYAQDFNRDNYPMAIRKEEVNYEPQVACDIFQWYSQEIYSYCKEESNGYQWVHNPERRGLGQRRSSISSQEEGSEEEPMEEGSEEEPMEEGSEEESPDILSPRIREEIRSLGCRYRFY